VEKKDADAYVTATGMRHLRHHDNGNHSNGYSARQKSRS